MDGPVSPLAPPDQVTALRVLASKPPILIFSYSTASRGQPPHDDLGSSHVTRSLDPRAINRCPTRKVPDPSLLEKDPPFPGSAGTPPNASLGEKPRKYLVLGSETVNRQPSTVNRQPARPLRLGLSADPPPPNSLRSRGRRRNRPACFSLNGQRKRKYLVLGTWYLVRSAENGPRATENG